MKSPSRLIALTFVFALALALNARANLIQDPGFNSITYSGTLPMTTLYGMFGTETGSTLKVADWTATGYDFVYAPGTGDAGNSTSGANSGEPNEAPEQYNVPNGYGNNYLWGPGNGSSNGFTSTDPAGGNFIAMDGTFERGAVSQVITGLTAGQVYSLKFYFAGGQQQGYTTATTETLAVSLGSQTFMTGTTSIAGKGFSGWTAETFYYTATGTSETLSFLASGTPNGQPPFSLFGGVDLEVIPDFSNWMVFAGFGCACVVVQGVRRRRQAAGNSAVV